MEYLPRCYLFAVPSVPVDGGATTERGRKYGVASVYFFKLVSPVVQTVSDRTLVARSRVRLAVENGAQVEADQPFISGGGVRWWGRAGGR